MNTRRILIPIMALAALSATSLEAQQRSRRFDWRPPPRFQLGVGLAIVDPVGDFANFVDLGGGLNLYTVANLDRRARLGLRLDGSFTSYGSETVRRPLSNTIGRVTVDITTTNSIVSLGAGPQLTLGGPAVRVYGFGTAGFSYFTTTSSVRGTSDFDDFASTTNFDDFTFTLGTGGGMLIGLSRGRTPVALDLGAQYLSNGMTRYLREGSITEFPDGSIAIDPIESETNMVVFRIGVNIGIR